MAFVTHKNADARSIDICRKFDEAFVRDDQHVRSVGAAVDQEVSHLLLVCFGFLGLWVNLNLPDGSRQKLVARRKPLWRANML